MTSKTILAAIKNYVAMHGNGAVASHGYTSNGVVTVFVDSSDKKTSFVAMREAADLVRSTGRKTYKVRSHRQNALAWCTDGGAIRVGFSFTATDAECEAYLLGMGAI